jgi:uncharacterized protein (DUF885 family)
MLDLFKGECMKNHLIFCGIILICISITAFVCNKEDMSSGKKTQTGADFTKLSDDFISGYLDWRPGYGTGLGLHEYDGKAPDLSQSSIDKELSRFKEYKSKLAATDTNSLGTREKFDYDILRLNIDYGIFEFEKLNRFRNNPMTYASVIDVNIYIKRNYAPLEERFKSVTAVLKAIPNIMALARKNLADSLPKPFVETAIQIAKGNADFLEKDVITASKELKDSALIKEFNDADKNAVKEYKDYITYLEKEKLPKANNNFALGLDNYKKMLLYEEMITLEPEKILQIGLDELHREQKQFEETAKIIEPNKKPIEVFKDIQRDHPTAENLIPDTKKNLEAIRQFLIDRKIITLPTDVRVKVEETPQYQRATSFASMDTPGPFEKKATEAYYYVTPVEEKWSAKQKDEWLTAFNYYTTDIVSIHEAYPGHYIQFIHMNNSPATKLEKIFGSYAFTEGWAHYSEQMTVDEGFGAGKDSVTAAKYRLAQLDEALLRLCRLCVSIKMHCQGMSVEDATKFFQDNCYYEHEPARQEAVRGTFDPGYLFYTLGKLMILKLREDYKKQEGSNYTLQKFHDAMLEFGMPPIPLLRKMMLKDSKIWNDIL